jgi:hypothetical protein
MLSGPDRKALRAALSDAFSEEELTMLADEYLEVRFADFEGDNYPTRLYSFLESMNKEDRISELVDAAVRERPRNQRVLQVQIYLGAQRTGREIQQLGRQVQWTPGPGSPPVPGPGTELQVEFRRVLVGLFPDPDDLEIVLSDLGQNLKGIAKGDLEHMALDVTQASLARGWLPSLWRLLRERFPDSPYVKLLDARPDWASALVELDAASGTKPVPPDRSTSTDDGRQTTSAAPEPGPPARKGSSEEAFRPQLVPAAAEAPGLTLRGQQFAQLEELDNDLRSLIESLELTQQLDLCGKVGDRLAEVRDDPEMIGDRRYWASLRDLLTPVSRAARSISEKQVVDDEIEDFEQALGRLLGYVEARRRNPAAIPPDSLLDDLDEAYQRMADASATVAERCHRSAQAQLEALRALLREIKMMNEGAEESEARRKSVRNLFAVKGGNSNA